MLSRFYPICLCFLLSFAACGEKEGVAEQKPVDPPKEVNIENISGDYLVTKVEMRNASGTTDVTEYWFKSIAGECSRDDMTTLKPDGSMVVLDGSYACDETTDDTGTWQLLSKTSIRLDRDTTTITALTAKYLSVVNPVYRTAEGEFIFTYQRQ